MRMIRNAAVLGKFNLNKRQFNLWTLAFAGKAAAKRKGKDI
jgi:hypothetical protein